MANLKLGPFQIVPDCSWSFLIVPGRSWLFLTVPDTNDQIPDRSWPLLTDDWNYSKFKSFSDLIYHIRLQTFFNCTEPQKQAKQNLQNFQEPLKVSIVLIGEKKLILLIIPCFFWYNMPFYRIWVIKNQFFVAWNNKIKSLSDKFSFETAILFIFN